MSLIEEFKAELGNAIDTFSRIEGDLSQEQAKNIIELRHLIEKVDSAVHLRQEISLKLRRIPSKLFAFFPTVNDLPKAIRRVLSDPLFAESQLLIASYGDLYEENKRLQEENRLLREDFEKFKVSELPEEIAKSVQALKEENIRLTTEAQQMTAQHEQAMSVKEKENKELKLSIITIMRDKQSLETELEHIKIEKQELSQNQIKTADKNRMLKEENKRLKEQLEAFERASKANGQSNSSYSPSTPIYSR